MKQILLALLLLGATLPLAAQPDYPTAPVRPSPTPIESPTPEPASVVPERPVSLPPPPAPPGINIHLVHSGEKGTFWRGAAPLRDTMKALQKEAQLRGRKVTLIDLRHPANADDRSGKSGRLTPAGEEKMASELGLRYRSVSAFERDLPHQIRKALQEGDVYIHCMYGVNRTGFAVARYATAHRLKVERTGLGPRDWSDGAAYQRLRR